ncbi:TPA: YbdD/YjiX family protein, partial [Klebsiella pneumoniae]|nr:YbdD/YjiX family protein [Klebsiella pneumoniae]
GETYPKSDLFNKAQTNHPDQPYMTYEEFFRERQQARYGGDGKGGVRCC